jgi:hypothetical protein
MDADKIYTLNDIYPEIGNIVSQEASGDGTAFTVTNDKGLKFEIRYNEHEITVTQKTAPGTRNVKDKVVTSFQGQEINKAIQDFINDKTRYEISDELKSWMDNNEGIEYSKDDLNAIKRTLRKSLEDEGILEDSDIILLENIIDTFINQINTSDC